MHLIPRSLDVPVDLDVPAPRAPRVELDETARAIARQLTTAASSDG